MSLQSLASLKVGRRVPKELSPPFKEGWQAERFKLQLLSRTTPHDEQPSNTILSTPPLALPFPEGWQSKRFRLQPLSRTTPHDEQQSSTLLKTPPLSLPFPEGWQAERYHLFPIMKSLREEQVLAYLNFAVPPTPLFDGWPSDKPKVYATGKTVPHDEQQSSTILRVPPLAPAFKDGWQAQDARQIPVRLRLSVSEQLLFATTAVVVQPQGWDAQSIRPAMGVTVKRLDSELFAPAILVSPVGWDIQNIRRLGVAAVRRQDADLFAPVVLVSPAGWSVEGRVQIKQPLRRAADDTVFYVPASAAFLGWQIEPAHVPPRKLVFVGQATDSWEIIFIPQVGNLLWRRRRFEP
jgi:hypothetical protein